MLRAFLGLGSNLGNRLEYLQRALGLLEQSPEVQVIRISSVYETEPVGFTEQGKFYNAVAEIKTSLPPRVLLKLILDIELRLGR
ncbi:MAG: 2-amino-4-hydroxy-6-hydroxymethyldihydropteridine diphosphokinase, partial [Firmicutes bacterium]|nr:2-amino-4-hydroxy-6-hydroxymethyldihydropteridine diphosphokinase [Bacillota bacterium]